MKTFFKTAAAAAILAMGTATTVSADGHGWQPDGPINLLIAFAAGGGADTQARLIADQVQEATGWEIIPEQVTGAGGINAVRALQDMPADGTAIAMVVTESLGYNAAANPDAGVTPESVTPLTTTAGFQMAVVAPASSGWTSFEDMMAAAQGGQDIRFGVMSPKLADLAYLLGEANGAEFNIISVRGGRAVMDGVVAGDMDVGFMAGIQGAGVAAGDLVNLASALSSPLAQTPDAPTLSDLGVEFNADGYFVFVGPAGMPDDARAALTDALIAASNNGAAADMIGRAFSGTVNISGADLDALLANDFEAAGQLLEATQ